MRLQRSFLLSLQSLLLAKVAFAAFGFTTSGNSINVDTNAGLLFTVDKSTGDISSMKFNGIEVPLDRRFDSAFVLIQLL